MRTSAFNAHSTGSMGSYDSMRGKGREEHWCCIGQCILCKSNNIAFIATHPAIECDKLQRKAICAVRYFVSTRSLSPIDLVVQVINSCIAPPAVSCGL